MIGAGPVFASKGSRLTGTSPARIRPPNARAPLPSGFAPASPYQAAPDDTGPTSIVPYPAVGLYAGFTGGLMLRVVTVPDWARREPDAARSAPPDPVVHMAANFEPTTAAPSIGAALAPDADSHWVAFDGQAAVAEPLVMT